MNKPQVAELYDRVATNWNLKAQTKQARLDTVKVWERYLGGLPYDETSRAIDARALAGGFPPKPAELFTDVLTAGGYAPPGPAQALVDSKSLTEAVQHGTKIPDVHPLVAQTIADVGMQRDDVFQKIYEERRREFLAGLLDNPPSYPDGGNKREEEDGA